MVQDRDDEFDLLKLFQTLWNKKFTLLLITFIFFLFGVYYTNNLSIKYNVSTPIKYGKQSYFIKYTAINEVLKENKSLIIEQNLDRYLVDAKSIFEKFIVESGHKSGSASFTIKFINISSFI